MATRTSKRKASANASKGSRPTSRHKYSEDLSGNESDNDLLPVGDVGDVGDKHDKLEVQRQNCMLVDASAASSFQSTRVDGVNEETRQTKATTYHPTSIEKQIHDKIGHLDHQGKDPQSILEYEQQARGSLLLTAPPVVRGAYDFGFKIRGLSVMHFVSVARIAAMDNDDPGMNMTDFSLKKLNSPPYDKLKDALENLRQFDSTFYTEETVAVLRAAQRFIESYGRGCTTDRDTTRRLVFWLNTKLCQFCGVVFAEGLDEAVRIQAEFSHQDALLAELIRDQHEAQIATMKAQLESKSSSGNSAHTNGRNVRSAKQSGTPKSVLSSLPKQGKLTLCMKYVSKEGCNGGESPNKCFSTKRAHFRPKKLAAEVKEHIENRFGGLAHEFADL
ncbi:hypothetical protein PHMEG_00012905 [Phytophthora megakarya]|uniref:Uncharacterized protein n=1 Tax=Phytophthora megakarya TaxID=4795 RepID=A0A225W995_9STRA|nr:hypothetical protein PHMEG_00012905 [Phytophthora megakarya]